MVYECFFELFRLEEAGVGQPNLAWSVTFMDAVLFTLYES
jgi:hypothetical protein